MLIHQPQHPPLVIAGALFHFDIVTMVLGALLILVGITGWKFALRGRQVEHLGAPTMRVLCVLAGVMFFIVGLFESGLLRRWLG